MGQAAAAGAEHAEGMGLIHQQGHPVARAEGCQRGQGRRAAFHAVEAFAEHQQGGLGAGAPLAEQEALEIGRVVVGEALQPGAAGPHAGQQRMVDQAIGQHQAVAIGEGADGGQVGLEAAGEEQHPLAPQPGGQGLLQLQMHRPGAADQARGGGAEAAGLEFSRSGRQHGRVATEAQVVVAGQVQQGGGRRGAGISGPGVCGSFRFGRGALQGCCITCGRQAAEAAAADGGNPSQGRTQPLPPGWLGNGSRCRRVGRSAGRGWGRRDQGSPDAGDRCQSEATQGSAAASATGAAAAAEGPQERSNPSICDAHSPGSNRCCPPWPGSSQRTSRPQ